MSSSVQLSNRIYVPSEHVERRMLKAWTHRFMVIEDQEYLDEDGEVRTKQVKVPLVVELFGRNESAGGRDYYHFHRGDYAKCQKWFGHLDWTDRRSLPPMGVALQMHPHNYEDRTEQRNVRTAFLATPAGGCVRAPTAWGKTGLGLSSGIMAAGSLPAENCKRCGGSGVDPKSKALQCSCVVNPGTRTLILAHRTNWLQDWLRDARKLTNIEKMEHRLGRPLAGVINIKSIKSEADLFPCFNLATFQTFMSKRGRVLRRMLRHSFGLVVADESVSLAAEATGKVFTSFAPRYRMALSADEVRKDGFHALTYDFAGPIVASGTVQDVSCEVIIEKTNTEINTGGFWGNQWFGILATRLAANADRNKLAASRIVEDVQEGFVVLVLVNRRNHPARLRALIEKAVVRQTRNGKTRRRTPVVLDLMGGDPQAEVKKAKFNTGKIDVLIASDAIAKMNINLPRCDCVHDLVPTNNVGIVKQRAGRVRRPHPDKITPSRLRVYQDAAVPSTHPAARMIAGGLTTRLRWYEAEGFTIRYLDEYSDEPLENPAASAQVKRRGKARRGTPKQGSGIKRRGQR